MTDGRASDDDRVLDEALGELPVPELSAGLRLRLQAIPERGNVRRFPVRSLRVSAFGWAAAAAIGLFIGAQSIESELAETAESASVGTAGVSTDEDETVELAVGSFAEFGEEP
ncbi:MAG TPA: hypothetical protein VMS65_01215 [Polyangiaceae bacterium]|nr:hypothetical protein [Polyangiaceae bacterium]